MDVTAPTAASAAEIQTALLDQQKLADQITTLARHMEAGRLGETLEPLLPLLFQLDGKPLTLNNHFQFGIFFRTRVPQVFSIKAARQTGKSFSMAASIISQSAITPYFKSLVVTPLFEQVRRFSSNYVRPLMEDSPVRSLWVNSSVEQSVLQKTMLNRSKMLFSYASLDADRIRGISSDRVAVDEIQDMDISLIPIILETLSHSNYTLLARAGTPKGFDNPVEDGWQSSSQAEWFIKCRTPGCNEWNIPSVEFHLLQMIGPVHDNISPTCPATVCYKCQKPIDAKWGCWVHRYPERRWTYCGIHTSQVIAPIHYTKPTKWSILRGKMQGNVPPNVFHNEVLAESYDVGSKLVSLSELKTAACLPWKNNPREPGPEVLARLRNYQMTTLGVDWGGGGEDRVSFTTLAFCGLRTDGSVDVLWGKRLMLPNEHVIEANEVLRWMKLLKPTWISHDFNGAGRIRHTIMLELGVPADRVICIEYDRSSARELVKYVPPTDLMKHARHRVNRTGSLLTTINGIKYGKVRFFEYDYVSDDNPGLIRDFLALTEEKVESATVGDHYLIRRLSAFPDDFAHAVNYACTAMWHATGTWPKFADVMVKLAKKEDTGGSWS